MVNKISALAAVAFVFSTQGVTAASISEARLQELMASTSIQEVSLETLRARDREILEELARSLATRYSDVLAGSEMVFTRLSESGSLFYRLDFVGLKNRDHARALCEVLEMERCIAKIGDDRLTVLDVQTDPIVSAIAIVEEDVNDEPFDWIEEDPVQDANPKAREIEAHVREMLDPLRAFPNPRPEFSFEAEEAKEVAVAKPVAPPVAAPAPLPAPVVPPEAEATPEAEPAPTPAPSPETKEDKDQADAEVSTSSLYPIARPFHDVAQFENHPEPFDRPLARLAELTAPQVKEPVRVALYPLARPFGAQLAEVETPVEAAPVLAEVTPAPSVAPRSFKAAKLSSTSAPISMTAAPMGSFTGGYIEVADVGVMPVSVVADTSPTDTVVRIPGIGNIDLSKINAVVPQIEVARTVLPGISPKAKKPTAHASRVAQVSPVVTPIEAVKPVERNAPSPMDRSFALADMAQRQAAEAQANAFAAGEKAPHPVLRQAALLEIAPTPSVMTSVAALSTGAAEMDTPASIPNEISAPDVAYEVAQLDVSLDTVDIAMATPEDPEQPVRMVAEKAPAPAPVPRRLNIQMPDASPQIAEAAVEPKAPVAAPAPQIAEVAPEKIVPVKPAAVPPSFSGDKDKRATMAALAIAQASTRASRLGSVSFDDRYARPASVDFSEGRVAGRLQKLPLHRPDLTGFVKSASHSATPLREHGAPAGVAMLSDRNAPFEIAQVPGSMVVPDVETSEKNQPFVLEEAPEAEEAPGDLLDRLLAGNAKSGASTDTVKRPTEFVSRRTEKTSNSDTDDIFGALAADDSAPKASMVVEEETRPTGLIPEDFHKKVVAKMEADIEAEKPAAVQPPLALTPTMRVPAEKKVSAPQPKLVAAPRVAPQQKAQVTENTEPKASVTFEAPKSDQNAYEARQIEEDAAKQRRALEALSQIVQERQTVQSAETHTASAPAARRQEFPATQGSMQRRPAPSAGSIGNTDMAAARELAGYEASFSDDRTRMERASNPRGMVSPAERMQRHNSLAQAAAPSDLRIELSYVGSREQVQRRVAELKSFFPPVMMTKGRFFGATVPEQPHRFVVGFAATDLSTRDDIIWYLEQMGLPWAIR